MKRSMHGVLTGACAAVLAASAAGAQAPPAKAPASPETRALVYGPNITLEQAEKVVAAGEAEAARRKLPITIAVVDTSGALVMFKKATVAPYTATDYAIKKAVIAARSRRPSSFDAERLEAGNKTAGYAPDTFPFPGGVPIVFHGQVIGAVGETGGADEDVAKAAAAALR